MPEHSEKNTGVPPLLKKNSSFYYHEYECLPEYMNLHPVCLVLKEASRVIASPGNGVADDCELPRG